mmetsp:Transcript_80954/g.203715  ORF Transcript_80954/g.203715 Transcript_80954/m.203715 type:complete len:122 (-) Transcript_80954:176-541(-)
MVKGHAFRKGWKEARKPMNRRASSRVKSKPKLSLEKKTQAKREMDEVKRKTAELLEAKKELAKLKAKKREAKKRRKQENDIKSGQYQVIKNTEKIRKWHKNAKKKLMTMGPEQIDRLLLRS